MAHINSTIQPFKILVLLVAFYFIWRPGPQPTTWRDGNTEYSIRKYPGTYRLGYFWIVSPLVNAGWINVGEWWGPSLDLGFLWYEAGKVGWEPPLFLPWEKV